MRYRNFEIRVEELIRVPESLRGAWRPCWRELPDGKWNAGGVVGSDEADALRIARACVDYDYRVKVWEFLNGRKYDAIKDGLIEAFEGSS